MIYLTVNYPYDALGFPIRDTEDHQFGSIHDALYWLEHHPGWSSYVITGTVI